ncbi:MAG: hypothetical protein Ct9H300mP18_14200 [Candidatus Neomarinimicrobiota bacterium]|nr:MAG: hypothetical protein Ct9H300mP18_14200 [Candidatus Neomarinimicrobiota bacterium]
MLIPRLIKDLYFLKIFLNENTSNPNTFFIHEFMGRHCGWLTAATARKYRSYLLEKEFNSKFFLGIEKNGILDAI